MSDPDETNEERESERLDPALIAVAIVTALLILGIVAWVIMDAASRS